jgi:hypothetical protein
MLPWPPQLYAAAEEQLGFTADNILGEAISSCLTNKGYSCTFDTLQDLFGIQLFTHHRLYMNLCGQVLLEKLKKTPLCGPPAHNKNLSDLPKVCT